MKKFTVIYLEGWMSGSHYQSLTLMKRIEQRENETVLQACQREGIADSVVFIFQGWPLLEGEN